MRKFYSFLILSSIIVSQGAFAQPLATRSSSLILPGKSASQVVFPIGSPNQDSVVAATLFGSCVEILNFQSNISAYQSAGILNDSAAILGFSDGLVLTTGIFAAANGPNSSPNVGFDYTGLGDVFLEQLIAQNGPGYLTRDAMIIEFDFIPIADTIYASDFVFGSEEYPEYVWSSYNDAFAFWISGPGINGMENLALVPGTNKPISINTINQDSASTYYWLNDTGAAAAAFQYDGFTTTIPLYHAVTPLDTYHFRIAIADASDGIYDSGVFIRKASFCGNTFLIWSGFVAQPAGGNTIAFTNTSGHADGYLWDFGDGSALSSEEHPTHTFPTNGTYNVRLIADNICKTDTFMQTLDLLTVNLNPQPQKMKADWLTLGDGIFNLKVLLTAPNDLTIEILNNQGQVVKSISKSGGRNYEANFDLSSFAYGVYFVRLQTPTDSKLIRFIR